MNQSEQVALRWLSNYVHQLTCDNCGGHWVVGTSIVCVFHRCQTRPHFDWRSPRQRVDEDRGLWARRVLGPMTTALEEAVGGPDAWYQE